MESTSVRFLFDDLGAAADAMNTVLLDARHTDLDYRFYGLNLNALLQSGLVMEGEIQNVAAKVEALPGTTRYDE